MNRSSATWDEIKRLLGEARNEASSQGVVQTPSRPPVGLLTGTLEEFEDFLDHDEFELAWDAIAAVAERTQAPNGVWHKLAQAASLMQLPHKERAAAQHIVAPISSDRALAIARTDAERVYRDLSRYRTAITLANDGWHIDYELQDANVHGGGPHYIIDPADGHIIAKRYEQ